MQLQVEEMFFLSRQVVQYGSNTGKLALYLPIQSMLRTSKIDFAIHLDMHFVYIERNENKIQKRQKWNDKEKKTKQKKNNEEELRKR